MRRIRAATGALALLWTTAETAPEPVPPEAVLTDLRAAADAAEKGDCARAIDRATAVRRSAAFKSLSGELRMATLQLAGLCAASLDRGADAYRDLRAATAFADSADEAWRMRLIYELDDKRFADAVATIEAMSNGRGAALAGVPTRWLYQLDRQMKDAGQTALRRRLLAILSQSGYDPDEAGVGNAGFQSRYATLLYDAGERAAALAIVRQIEEPTLVVDLSLDPRFRAAFPADLKLRPMTEKRLAGLQEAALTHPDQIGPVNDVARMLRLLGRPKDSLAALEAIRAKVTGDAELSDRGDQAVWWWDQLARAHRALGDRAAQIAALEKGSAMVEHGGANVSQTINLAEAQLAAGRPTDALGTLARLEGAKKRASPYGAMQIVSDRGCARARLGRANDAAADLATARAHVADAPEALTRLLLCLGDMDGAAQAMIARLGDRDQRIDALRDLSEFARPSTPPDDPTELRLIELKARPDVKAAAAQAGGTRTFDIGAMDS